MMKELNKARLFAIERHKDQLYAGKPYVFHLTQVVQVLQEFGYTDLNLLQAGYLHDTLEDTKTNYWELHEKFGEPVAALVTAVTGVGDSRNDRTHDTIEKLSGHLAAIPPKMADRLANMRFSSKNSRKHINNYVMELPKYKKLFVFCNKEMYDEMAKFKHVME